MPLKCLACLRAHSYSYIPNTPPQGYTSYTINLTFLSSNVNYLTIVTAGDTTHDPTSVTIYSNTSKTTQVGSFTSLGGKTRTRIALSTPYNGTNMTIVFGNSTTYQIYMYEVSINK